MYLSLSRLSGMWFDFHLELDPPQAGKPELRFPSGFAMRNARRWFRIIGSLVAINLVCAGIAPSRPGRSPGRPAGRFRTRRATDSAAAVPQVPRWRPTAEWSEPARAQRCRRGLAVRSAGGGPGGTREERAFSAGFRDRRESAHASDGKPADRKGNRHIAALDYRRGTMDAPLVLPAGASTRDSGRQAGRVGPQFH